VEEVEEVEAETEEVVGGIEETEEGEEEDEAVSHSEVVVAPQVTPFRSHLSLYFLKYGKDIGHLLQE